MTTTIVQKGAVISIGSPIGANVSVTHKDGSVNEDCISVARLPTGEKYHHYILQDGDIITTEVSTNKLSLREIKLQTVELSLSGDRYIATIVDGCDTALKNLALEVHKKSNTMETLNARTIRTLISKTPISSLLTHGPMLNVVGHPTDYLFDTVGILFEQAQPSEKISLRTNAIQSIVIVDVDKKLLQHDSFIDLHSGSFTEYTGGNDSLLITRSLKHAMRLTVTSHSADRLDLAKGWFEQTIQSTGHQIRKTKTKRGELFIVLPKISQQAIELCKTLG